MYNFDTSFMGFVQCPQSVIYMCLKPHLSYNEDTVFNTMVAEHYSMHLILLIGKIMYIFCTAHLHL